MKETEDDTDGKMYSAFDWKNGYIQMSIYRFNAIIVKLPGSFSTQLEQKIFNLCRNTKDPE